VAALGEHKANVFAMPSTATIRLQIEAALADRIPSALTPAPRILRPQAIVGIESVDELLAGGLPLGAVTEIVGPECSGRTSFALSFVSGMTQAGKVCAWIDVSNCFQPEAAAAIGTDLSRLLWVRCGLPARSTPSTTTTCFSLPKKYLVPSPVKKGLHGGGFGPHPRNEVKGLSVAVSEFLKPQRRVRAEPEVFEPNTLQPPVHKKPAIVACKPWVRIEQALRVMDLLLQGGGFSCLVFDLGSIAPEYALRIPLATWFRYRASAERSQASILLLTQHPCAKSSAGLVLRLQTGNVLQEETTVFTGIEYRVEIARERFLAASSNVIPMRKPPQRATEASWQSRTTWAGRR
jgi:recombination protein RecA